MANSKQKASSVKETLGKHVSPHFLLMTVIILISSHSYLQSSALSAAYLVHVSVSPQMMGLLLSSLWMPVVTDRINNQKWWYWFQWRMKMIGWTRMIGLAGGWAVWIMCDSVVLKSLLCSVSRRRSLHAWLQPHRIFNMCLPGGENGLEVRWHTWTLTQSAHVDGHKIYFFFVHQPQ